MLLIVCIGKDNVDITNILYKFFYKKQYTETVSKYAELYNVDDDLVFAVIKAESNFKIDAKSNKNAIGLMQLMESTARDIAKKTDLEIDEENFLKQLEDPEININLGTKYLSTLIDKYQNIPIAVTAYNAGIGTVDNWIEKGIIKSDGTDIENVPYKETNNYVRKILRDYKIYKKIDYVSKKIR